MDWVKLYNDLMVEVDRGTVGYQDEGDLRMFHYKDRCQYDNLWNDVNIYARGIIYDRTAIETPVAVPFKKFFNYGERSVVVPDEPFVVVEKIDGSLGILFYHKGSWRIVTKGSFTSEQGKWATEYFKQNFHAHLEVKFTYLVEIVYPEDRKVVSYEMSGLYYLTSFYNETGEETNILGTMPGVGMYAMSQGFILPKVFSYHTIDELISKKNIDFPGQEGVVVRFDSGYRIKVKTDEYVKLHRMIADVTPGRILETYIAFPGQYEEIARLLPGDYQKCFRETWSWYDIDFNALVMRIEAIHAETRSLSDKELGLIKCGKIPSEYDPKLICYVFSLRKGTFDPLVAGSKTRKNLAELVYENMFKQKETR